MKLVIKDYSEVTHEVYGELDDDMQYPDYWVYGDWVIEDGDTGETFFNESYVEYGSVCDEKPAVTDIDEFKDWLEKNMETLASEYSSVDDVWWHWDDIIENSPYHKQSYDVDNWYSV